jgi:hypothetical protein
MPDENLLDLLAQTGSEPYPHQAILAMAGVAYRIHCSNRLIHEDACFVNQNAPSIRQFDSSPVAHEKFDSQFGFQSLYLPA